MAVSVRISSDVNGLFYSERDIIAWIRKVKVVARLQGIEDVASLMVLKLESSVP